MHNVKQSHVYPPILVTTADTDDDVVPLHAKPVSKIIEEQADVYAFLFDALGMD